MIHFLISALIVFTPVQHPAHIPHHKHHKPNPYLWITPYNPPCVGQPGCAWPV